MRLCATLDRDPAQEDESIPHRNGRRQREMWALFAGMDREVIAGAARGFDLLTAHLERVEEKHVFLGREAAAGPLS